MMNVEWKYDKSQKAILLKIEQTQKPLFKFPLQIGFVKGNQTVIETFEIKIKSPKKLFYWIMSRRK